MGGAACVMPRTAPAQAAAPPPANRSLSAGELIRIRKAVLPDLRKAVAIQQNEPDVKDVSEEFKECKITPINLGALGPAVVVEWNPFKAPNASMIDIFIPSGGAYRRIVASDGFGPYILPGPRPAPDLMFGGTAGACQASYSRYRYQRGRYSIDACDREAEAADGGCAIAACENKLPMFPDPFPDR
jgi:hypothetical protein